MAFEVISRADLICDAKIDANPARADDGDPKAPGCCFCCVAVFVLLGGHVAVELPHPSDQEARPDQETILPNVEVFLIL
jgi:hypothetical protein